MQYIVGTNMSTVVKIAGKIDGLIRSFKLSKINAVTPPPAKIRTINKKKDSTNLTVTEFEKYANTFLPFDITKQPLKSQLKESSFHDNSTKCNTLIYNPVNANIGDIRDVTVLLDEKTDKVKNIFIQTTRQIKDTTINENLQWKSRKSFRITTIKRAKDYYKEETNYISWNEASN